MRLAFAARTEPVLPAGIAARVALVVMATLVAMTTSVASAHAASNKVLFSYEFGWHVDKSTEGNVCLIASKDICGRGEVSAAAGGFNYAEGVALAPSGDVYVADKVNNRVDEFTASGQFVLAFGWEVNATADATGGTTQRERNLCTAASGDECQAGVATAAAGGLHNPTGITVNQAGELFVLENGNNRVAEYGPEGEFILMIGGEVDETKDGLPASTEAERNLCTASSGDVCEAGVRSAAGSSAHGAFKAAQFFGNLLAAGGPEDLLYVGDEGRVQEFTATGAWAGELSLSAFDASGYVTALAVDGAGDLYFACTGSSGIREVGSDGSEVASYRGTEAGATTATVAALAVNAEGRIGAVEREAGNATGVLYDAEGAVLSSFAPANGGTVGGTKALAFNPATGVLFAVSALDQDVEVYAPAVVASVVSGPSRDVGPASAVIAGEVDPKNVGGTTVFFRYGTDEVALEASAPEPAISIPTGSGLVPFEATLSGLRPNQRYYYRALAEDENTGGEPVEGAVLSLRTASVPPVIESAPAVTDVEPTSAVMTGLVNPENAATQIYFEYGPCIKLADCAGTSRTAVRESSVYSGVSTAAEASRLAPATAYSYRLVAVNEFGEEASSSEATFTTPAVVQPRAVTLEAGQISTDSAVIYGMVEPNGLSTTYTFRLGAGSGPSVVYGSAGTGGAGDAPVAVSAVVVGLQPGQTYSYTLVAINGNGTAVGEVKSFTTLGTAEVFSEHGPIAQLPEVAFPRVKPQKGGGKHRHHKGRYHRGHHHRGRHHKGGHHTDRHHKGAQKHGKHRGAVARRRRQRSHRRAVNTHGLGSHRASR